MIFNNIKSFIINVKENKQRKIKCEKMLKRRKIQSEFFIEPKNKNSIEGNKISHIKLIEKCIEDGIDNILILEDDFKIIGDIKNIPEFPTEWDILYLGGEVLRKIGPIKNGWVRCISKRHHAYIINLKNTKLITEIKKCLLKKNKKYCDWIAERIHPIFKTYILNPMVITQNNDYSDITKTFENYDKMRNSINSFFIPQHILKNDMYNLKLPEIDESLLPNISLVTILNNERDIFSLCLRNYQEIIYPKEKIEWIIIEKKNNKENYIKDLLTGIKNVSFNLVNNTLSSQECLDKAVELSSHEYIVMIDNYGFYSRESVLSRIKLLLKYKSQIGVGTNKIGIYDIVNNKSYINYSYENKLFVNSLSFRKKFYKSGNIFEDRLDKFINIPYTFIQYQLLFDKNEKKTNSQQLLNFYDTWDMIDKHFIDELGNYIKKKSNYNKLKNKNK